MNDQDALLRTILLDPEDDAPRLIYADWLDEHGQPERAKFIRVSIKALEITENGWMMQPHIHHPKKDLFRFPGLNDNQYLYRRGFIREVRLTCAAFVGGPCGRCFEGQAYAGMPGYVCQHCSGTARTPGLAVVLFAAHPVTKVVLTDKEPRYSPKFGDREHDYYIWFHEGGPEEGGLRAGIQDRACLPIILFDEVIKYAHDRWGSSWKDSHGRYSDACFLSVEEGMNALSAACVKWGRKVSGLEK